MMKMLYNMNPHGLTNVSSMTLDTGAFRTILTKNTWLINKSFQNQFIIPKFHDFCSDISHMYEMVRFIIQECYNLSLILFPDITIDMTFRKWYITVKLMHFNDLVQNHNIGKMFWLHSEPKKCRPWKMGRIHLHRRWSTLFHWWCRNGIYDAIDKVIFQ